MANLHGIRVLVVEDEWYQATEACYVIRRAGGMVIGPTGHADEVPALIKNTRVQVGIVDINLGLGADYSVARLLQQHKVPFVFLTGYDAAMIPDEFANVPRIEKPAAEDLIIASVASLLETRRLLPGARYE